MGLYTKNKAFLAKIIHTKFVANRLNFSNIKKGGRGLWVPPNHEDMLKKRENFIFFMLGMCKWKGVQKGGHEKGGQKGGHHSRTLVQTIHIIIRTSDRRFLNEKSDFLRNRWSSQYLGGCPPFAPPFFKFSILKNFESQILPESKINFISHLVPNIQSYKVKKPHF